MEVKKQCACCEYFTLENEFGICPVCFWQKDVYQEEVLNDFGEPNHVSLIVARENFKKLGAIDESFKMQVRPPTKNEMK